LEEYLLEGSLITIGPRVNSGRFSNHLPEQNMTFVKKSQKMFGRGIFLLIWREAVAYPRVNFG